MHINVVALPSKDKSFPSTPNGSEGYTCTSNERYIPRGRRGHEPSEHSMSSGIPLQVRLPLDVTPSSSDVAQLSTGKLMGIIRTSTEKFK
jgi:hypothetical protein